MNSKGVGEWCMDICIWTFVYGHLYMDIGSTSRLTAATHRTSSDERKQNNSLDLPPRPSAFLNRRPTDRVDYPSSISMSTSRIYGRCRLSVSHDDHGISTHHHSHIRLQSRLISQRIYSTNAFLATLLIIRIDRPSSTGLQGFSLFAAR